MEPSKILSLSDVKRNRAKLELLMPETKIIHTSNSDISGASILRMALKDNNLLKDSDLIFFSWFNLRTASSRLCEMIGRDLMHDGAPIIDRVLIDAIDVYKASVKNREADIKSMVRFLIVLSDAAFIVQKYGIFFINDRGERVAWPYFSTPFPKWLRQNREATFYMQPLDDVSTDTIIGNHILLCSRIMTPNDLGKVASLRALTGFSGLK